MFPTSKSRVNSILNFVWSFWIFKLPQGQPAFWTLSLIRNYMHHVIILHRSSSHQNLRLVQCWPLFKLSDLCATILNFQCSTQSNDLVNMIILEKLHALLKLYRNVLHIKILEEFDIDLYVRFQTSSRSNCLVNVITNCLVNVITPQEFHALCCKLYRDILHSKISNGFNVDIVWPFWTFKLAHSQIALWTQ